MSSEAHINFTIRFDQPLVVWVLQLGGWLPLQFSTVGIVLVDKNVLKAIEALTANPGHPDLVVEQRLLSNLNSSRFALNALLCAHEGDFRRIPSHEEFCASLRASYEILAAGMPEARLVDHRHSDLERAYENVTATLMRHAKESSFLLQIAPSLHARVSATNTKKTERALLSAARDGGLDLRSFVVLAALSCLYEPQDGSEPMIGRRVIKPKSNYSQADAHNALSDLRSLEMLSLAVGLEGPPIGYCTRDRGLAAFWTYLRVSNPTWSGNKFSATLSPAEQLFPRLGEAGVRDLLIRLQSARAAYPAVEWDCAKARSPSLLR